MGSGALDRLTVLQPIGGASAGRQPDKRLFLSLGLRLGATGWKLLGDKLSIKRNPFYQGSISKI